MVANLNFAGHGPDDLTAGCQQFLVTYTGTEDHYRAMDQAMVANQLDQGTANASLADIREIREKERVKLPQDLNQVSYTLQRYAILVSTLFQGPGTANPFVTTMLTLANTFNERLPLYLGQHQGLRGTPWYEVYPAHVVRHVQVNVYEYLQAVQVSDGTVTVPLPSFQGLHQSLQRGSFHLLVLRLASAPSFDHYRPNGCAIPFRCGVSCHPNHPCLYSFGSLEPHRSHRNSR